MIWMKLRRIPGMCWGRFAGGAGSFARGGALDYERGAKVLLEEFKNGKLGLFFFPAKACWAIAACKKKALWGPGGEDGI